jgi:putative ABC transport system substrate-binding protein
VDRRAFVGAWLPSIACLSLPRASAAADRKAKIGFLSWFPPSMKVDLDRFREGMGKLGYVDDKDYEIEAYFTAGNAELTRQLAGKLVQEPVDLLIVIATPAIHIVKAATQTIPIVMYTANALATGLVPSLSHPGGNLTGVSLLLTDLAAKRLDLLKRIRPQLRKVAFLGSNKDPNTKTFVEETQAGADRLGVALSVRLIDGPQALDQAIFDAMSRDGSEAVIVQPIFTGYQDQIVAMAMKARLPVVSDWAVFAEAGALFTYGAKQAAGVRRMAYYVDRIFKGAKPGDLPIEQPDEFELVVNSRTAAELGWEIPRDVAIRAEQTIE